MRSNNKVIVDLNKVQYVWLEWQTESGYTRRLKPAWPTAFNETIPVGFAPPTILNPVWPGETMYERAARRGLIDVWIPVCHLTLTANKSLIYTGKKAESIYKAWCAKQFKKKGKE